MSLRCCVNLEFTLSAVCSFGPLISKRIQQNSRGPAQAARSTVWTLLVLGMTDWQRLINWEKRWTFGDHQIYRRRWAVMEREAGSTCSLPHEAWGVSKGAGFKSHRRSWTFTQWVVGLQRSLLKGVLGAKSLPGFSAMLVRYQPCEAQKILRNQHGWRQEGYSGEGTCECPALALLLAST